MKQSEIPELPITDSMPVDTRKLRRKAPKYLETVIDFTRDHYEFASLLDLRPEQLEALGGGTDAATYLIHTSQTRLIIKLGYTGIEAEAEALNAWRVRHARVPRVVDSGIVPGTRKDKRPVKFLIQEAILNREGRVVETCTEYLAHHPDQARTVGRNLGWQLSKIHQAVSDRSFGEFADDPGSTGAYASWNNYMLDFFAHQVPYLVSLKIPEDNLAAIRTYIRTCTCVKRGRYLHGDFSIRNAAVKSYDPLKISIFDPNPLIGDPTWDIAPLFNNYEFQKRRLHHDDSQRELYVRDQQLVVGFKQTYRRRIYEGSLQVSRLLQAILQARFKEKVRTSKEDRLDLRVRQEYIRDLIIDMAKKGSV